MGDPLSLEIEGLEQLGPALDRLVADMHDASGEAATDMAEQLADEWRARAPVGQTPDDPHPGAYRDGITVQHEETAGGGSSLVNLHGEAVHYAARLEFGSAGVDSAGRIMHTPPQPSARPAFDAAQGRMQAAAAARLKARAEAR